MDYVLFLENYRDFYGYIDWRFRFFPFSENLAAGNGGFLLENDFKNLANVNKF